MKRYVNYHCHSQYSNVATPDVVIGNKDRILRAKELGHSVASGIEHGWGGNFFEFVDLCAENGLAPLLGVEAYFVKDRFEKDRTNAHIILLAKNDNGRRAINRILSEANRSGYYYKARIDLPLINTLPEKDVWVTTACLGGVWRYDDYEDIIVSLRNKFGDNFFLEVQYHDTVRQKTVNQQALMLSAKHGIEIIAGMDSHMISASGASKRDIFLASRGISYDGEEGWFLDFPDYDTVLSRFAQQGILSDEQAASAIEKTLVFEDVEPYTSQIFDKNKIKLPTIFPDLSQQEKDARFEALIWDLWGKERANVEESRIGEYTREIEFEIETVIKTGMADYFLLNYDIIRKAKEKGGQLTLTSRGSAPGFYLTKLLGFTTIDRLSARVKLYPQRFMSTERILQTKSLPDIDFNVGNPPVFEQAQTDVMGDGHSARMITYQKSGASNAWKLYARYKEVPFEDANKVSSQISEYEKAVRYADADEKDSVDIAEFVEPEYLSLYEKSKDFLGTIQSLGSHPCAFLLYDGGKLEEEIGLIRTRGGELCVAVDGKTADKRLFLKNDLLKVSVVNAIHRTYSRIGINPPSVPELISMCEEDGDVWRVYKNGMTMGINQVETPSTTKKVSAYAPKNISELSSFVAAIRPGFKSNYSKYAKRERFDYGVASVDELIQTDEFPYSYMLYQENAMAVLGYAGIPMFETYQVVKDIAKKNAGEVHKYKERFQRLFREKMSAEEGVPESDAENIAKMIWKIIEDSSNYSFNAAHAYSVANDSLYGAWQKAHYPLEFYETWLRIYDEDSKKDKIVLAKAEAERYFGISFPSFKWGQDNRQILLNKEDRSISMSLSTIKGFGDNIAEDLFWLSQNFKGDTFADLLIFAVENGRFQKSKWDKLIRINYFSPIVGGEKALLFFREFTSGKNRYSAKHTDKTKEVRSGKLALLYEEIPDTHFSAMDVIKNEMEILGSVNTRFDVSPLLAVVVNIEHGNPKYSPKVDVLSLRRGTIPRVKVYKKDWRRNPLSVGDVIFASEFEKKNKQAFKGISDRGKQIFEPIDGVFDYWMVGYTKVSPPLERFIGVNDFHKIQRLAVQK